MSDTLPGLPAGFTPVADTTPARAADAPASTADHTVYHRPTLQEQGRVRKLDSRDPDFLFREDSDWYFAPASSHISRWMPVEDEANGQFMLLVRFKGRGASEGRVYAYTFANYDQLRNIDDLMRTTSHPYSAVLNPLVIRVGIPYR